MNGSCHLNVTCHTHTYVLYTMTIHQTTHSCINYYWLFTKRLTPQNLQPVAVCCSVLYLAIFSCCWDTCRLILFLNGGVQSLPRILCQSLPLSSALSLSPPAYAILALQHAATRCNTLNTLEQTATHCTSLHRTATYCNTLQHACMYVHMYECAWICPCIHVFLYVHILFWAYVQSGMYGCE